MKKQDTIIVALGGGGDSKPHAARAKGTDEALVAKAAEAMGYIVGIAKAPKAQAIAKKLPEMKLFKTGRALVPRVKSEIFDQLTALLTFPKGNGRGQPHSELSATAVDEPANLEQPIPNPWGQIGLGSLVLAPDEIWAGWYEADVVGVESKDRVLILQWRDWPKQKRFALPRTAVGVPPSARPTTEAPESPEMESASAKPDAAQAARS